MILLMGLTGFIIYFIILYRKKQVLNLIEREKIAVQFQKELLKSQIEVQEQTMQTIGADLHDNIGQLLSLTSFTLKSINEDNIDSAIPKIGTVTQLIGRSIKELRLLGKLLHGEQLVNNGLNNAIAHEISWIEKSEKFKVNYQLTGEATAGNSADKDLIIFRIIQEILNNIIKHSEADTINLSLCYEPLTLGLVVSDNGTGFDLQEIILSKDGMGLANINRRVSLLNGKAEIDSSIGNGTIIKIQIPYP
jgi:signal transduction histidine kinase